MGDCISKYIVYVCIIHTSLCNDFIGNLYAAGTGSDKPLLPV